MATFFVKGLARLGELAFGAGNDGRIGSWAVYREKRQFEQEIRDRQEKAFSPELI